MEEDAENTNYIRFVLREVHLELYENMQDSWFYSQNSVCL